MGLESKKIKMVNETQNKPIEQIQKLEQFLPNEKQDELAKILDYWEKIKAEWEREKKEFWETYNRYDFKCLLRYYWTHIDEVEKRYKYLDLMSWLERKKFIEEYLYNDILYNEKSVGNMSYYKVYNHTKQGYSYEEWKKWKVKIKNDIFLYFDSRKLSFDDMKEITKNLELKEWIGLLLNNCWIDEIWLMELLKNLKLKKCVQLGLQWNKFCNIWEDALSGLKMEEWVELDLRDTDLWTIWAKAISKIGLKNWVTIDLWSNKIWDDWAKAISKMKLKEWVYFNLYDNKIWDDWAEAISKMKLKEWVTIYLEYNEIWDRWARAIIQNMKLKNNVTLYLWKNNISDEMKKELEVWAKLYPNSKIDLD